MWNKKEMSQLDATLTRVPLTLTFGLDLWLWIFKVKLYKTISPPVIRGDIMSQLDAMLTRVPLTLTFDREFSRSNCISGMGGGKPLKLISSNYTCLIYGCGNIFWHPSRWPWVKVTKLPKRNAMYIVPTIKWEPLIQLLQNIVGISPSLCFPPDFQKGNESTGCYAD